MTASSPPTPAPPAETPGTTRDDGIARNTAFAMATQLSSAAFTAVIVLVLVRVLGPREYGTFALALGLANLIALPADLGISTAAARFVAEHRGDPVAVRGVVRDAFRMKLAAVVAIAAILILGAPLAARVYERPELASVLRWVAVAVAAQGVMAFFAALVIASRRLSLNLRVVLLESFVEAGATIGLVLAGAGAAGAAAGRATGYVVGAAAGLVVAILLFGRSSLALRGPGAGNTRRIARYAGAMVIVDGAFSLFQQIDVLIIGAVLGATAVGLFGAPMRLLVLLHYPGLSTASSVAPRIAQATAGSAEVQVLARALRFLTVVQCTLVAPLLVWPEPITELLLGSQYAASAPVLRALTPFMLLSGLAPLASMSVNYLGYGRRRIPIALATLGLNFVVDIILIPRIGIVGGAIGTDLAYLIYVPAHLWISHRVIALPLRPLLRTLAGGLAAAGAMACVLAATGTGDLSAVQFVGGLAGGVAAYAAVVLLTRTLIADDLRLIATALPRRGAARRGGDGGVAAA